MNVKQPASALSSPRFCNMGTFMRMPRLDSAEGLDFAIAGAPFDTASSFPFRIPFRSGSDPQHFCYDETEQCYSAGKHHGQPEGS